MQALERIEFSNNWLTLVFMVGLLLLVVLKMLNHQKLFEYSRAFFLKGFIEKKVEERTAFFNAFNVVLFLFFVLVYALFFTNLVVFFLPETESNFQIFLKILILVLGYFSIFSILDLVLCHLLEIKTELAHFIAAKLGYSYTIALLLFPFLILKAYSFLTIYVLITVFVVLFTLRGVLTFINNKNLIINKLFYFILYLCALEIAPLLIIYKITV
ncbi:hypothetical protein KCTC32516_00752 [Polaribacter huanghezhanensis]|uniref:DUF4271 domain-containing protein n=1 Tax=Polaribacter huanghezhanensis TaxID=1354726 RepID=UPI002649FF27|nr:DUF4271 domain-containing protein [Polaribacter huanghezhanensis]WKD85412.1 hypothetical protein KCTC32516_00752 [Polaribacter huanghezhanensis]